MEVIYNPLGESELTTESALIQAAHLLDIAGHVAVESKDTDAMVEISQVFLLVADRLSHTGDDSEDKEVDERIFGFATDGVLESEIDG